MPCRFAHVSHAIALCVIGGVPALGHVQARAQAAPTPTELQAGSTYADRVPPNAVRSYAIRATADQFVRIVVRHEGAVVEAALIAADGSTIAEAASGPGLRGGDALSVVSAAPVTWRVDVRGRDRTGGPFRYELSVDPPRRATAEDARRIAAERAYAMGEKRREEPRVEASREAVALYRTAAAEAAAAGDQLLLADARDRLGVVHEALGEYPAALEEYTRALAVARAAGDRRREADTLVGIGVTTRLTGKVRDSFAYYEQALQIQREIGDEWGEATALYSMATAFYNTGDLDRALDNQMAALAIRQRIGDAIGAAETMIGIGVSHRARGDTQTALMYYVDALAAKRALGDRRGEYRVLHNMGTAYSSIGDNQRALEYFTASLQLSRPAADKVWLSASTVGAATANRLLGEYDAAETLYQEALAVRRELGDPRAQGEVLSNLGLLFERRGDLKAALAHYEQALTFNRAANDRRGEAATTLNLAHVYLYLENPEKADETFSAALALQKLVGDRNMDIEVRAGLAHAAVKRGDRRGALREIDSALAVIDRVGAGLPATSLRAAYFGTRDSIVGLQVRLLMELAREEPAAGHLAAAFLASDRAKARTLRELLAEVGTAPYAGPDSPLAGRERQLRAQVSAAEGTRLRLIEQRADAAKVGEAERALETLRAQYEVVDSRLRAATAISDAILTTTPPALLDIQQLIPADSVLIEYALGAERSHAWMVTAETIRSAELPARQAIETVARRAYERIAESDRLDARAAARAAAAELSDLVIAPLATEFGGKRLLIVADGALHYVPFGVLPDPRHNGTPLLARHEIVMLPSASVIPALRNRPGRSAPTTTVAVIADPVLQPSDARVRQRVGATASAAPAGSRPRGGSAETVLRSAAESGGVSLDRLEFSATEADEIERLARPSSVKLVGFDASRERVAGSALADFRIIHFATHGLLNSQRPELSGVVLSLLDRQGQPVDGFVRVNDIFNLRLNADLVVLSACRTALGSNIRGEGLIGMTRGFMYAGAPRIVASLWDVRDRATAELMKRFYGALLKDRARPAAALRQAQLSMLAEPRWSAPFYWAGFVMQGDWH